MKRIWKIPFDMGNIGPDKEDLVDPITIVIPSGSEFVNVIGEMAGAMPMRE